MFKQHSNENVEKIEKASGGNIIRAFEANSFKGEKNSLYLPPSLINSKRSSEEIPQKDKKFSIDPLLRGVFKNDEELENKINFQVEERLEILRKEVERAAHEEGFQKGFEEGKSEALNRYTEESNQKCDEFQVFLENFEKLKNEIYENQEKFILHLFFKCAKTILKKECSADPEFIKRTLFAVIDEMGLKDILKIWIHPNDYNRVKELRPEIEAKFSQLKNFTIEAKEEFSENDIVVETDWNRMDASFETQINRIYERMLLKCEEIQSADKNV